MPFSRSLFDSCIFHKPTNENNAIVVGSDATCLIVDCKQIDSTIVFRPHSHGMILRCNIKSEVGSGVIIHEGATPLIQSSQINGCKTSGIILQAGSKGVITGNKIINNKEFGFNARSAEKFVLNNNEIYNNKGGVRVSQGSIGTLINNLIKDNDNGVVVETNCRLNIRRCNICNNKQNGLCVMHNVQQVPDRISLVRIIDSEIFGNKQFGIYCMEGSEVHAIRTSIYNNEKFGIFNKETCLIRLQDSNVYGNKSLQIHSINHSIFEATGSHFYKAEQQALLFNEDSQGRFTNCTWEFNQLSLKALGNANITLNNCHFRRNTQCIVGSDHSNINIEQVDFNDNAQFCVMGLEHSNFNINGISCQECYSAIECTQSSIFNVNKCIFTKCSERAILTDGQGVELNVSDSNFYTCGKSFSVYIQKCRSSKFSGSTFVGATRNNDSKKILQTSQIAIKITSLNVVIDSCIFMNFPYYGIEVDHQGLLKINNSKFQSCGRSAIRVTNGSKADITRNTIGAGHIYAVNLSNNSYAKISENVIGEMREKGSFVQVAANSRYDAKDNVNENGEPIA
ncbi:F-box only protein 10 [Histomonas meleagridis]|nr:F-box only protein 10 [Histomonas meleagridis]